MSASTPLLFRRSSSQPGEEFVHLSPPPAVTKRIIGVQIVGQRQQAFAKSGCGGILREEVLVVGMQ